MVSYLFSSSSLTHQINLEKSKKIKHIPLILLFIVYLDYESYFPLYFLEINHQIFSLSVGWKSNILLLEFCYWFYLLQINSKLFHQYGKTFSSLCSWSSMWFLENFSTLWSNHINIDSYPIFVQQEVRTHFQASSNLQFFM